VDLDEREVRHLETAARMWDLETVEVWASLLEKVREAGYLSAPATSDGLFVHKGPNDWGWSTSAGGQAYLGRNGGPAGNADTP
jgi:hypothetical protein